MGRPVSSPYCVGGAFRNAYAAAFAFFFFDPVFHESLADTRRTPSFIYMRIEFLAEPAQDRQYRIRRGFAETAQTGVLNHMCKPREHHDAFEAFQCVITVFFFMRIVWSMMASA